MNINTAKALRATCSQVLGVLDDWESVDVSKLDVDDIFRRFQNKKGKQFTPKSLETYKSRFGKAVESFLRYVESPTTWRASSTNVRTKRKEEAAGTRKKSTAGGDALSSTSASVPTIERQRTIEYPLPLRDGRLALLRLPPDLSLAEVRRINAFLTTVAVDFDPDSK
ncbi:MAG TPA: hypothetical protein VER58_08435 [Thermoanaerobaculia bacterium]|nr:hypothetical protein [Thermoanaerobaculia bacterium]